jgi:hypothetical protein
MGYVLCGVSYQLTANRKTHQRSESEQAAPWQAYQPFWFDDFP